MSTLGCLSSNNAVTYLKNLSHKEETFLISLNQAIDLQCQVDAEQTFGQAFGFKTGERQRLGR